MSGSLSTKLSLALLLSSLLFVAVSVSIDVNQYPQTPVENFRVGSNSEAKSETKAKGENKKSMAFEVKSHSRSYEQMHAVGEVISRLNSNLIEQEARGQLKNSHTSRGLQKLTPKALGMKSIMQSVLGSNPSDEEITAVLEVLDYFNTIYTVKVNFAGKDIDVIMDTGSSDVTVNSNLCTTNGCITSKKVFPLLPDEGDYFSDLSDNILALEDTWEITYAGGSLYCRLGVGRVSIGDVEVPDQEMCLITYEEDILDPNSIYQSVFGLSFWFEDSDAESFMQNIVTYNEYVDPVITFALSRDFNGVGLMTIGTIDNSLYFSDEVVYHDSIMDPYWTVKLEAILVGGEDIGLCTGEEGDNCALIVDTGSSYNAMPTEGYVYLIKYLNDANGGGCADYNSYPDITYVIGEEEYTLTAAEYLTVEGDGFASMYDSTVDADQISSCYMNVYTLDYIIDDYLIYLVGDVFISKYYTIFDFENKQVAFGTKTDAE